MIKDIEIEPLSATAFAPYGWLLAAGDAPDFERPGLKNWRLPYESDAELRLQVMRYSKQQRQLSMFERHIKVTEARSPIGDATAILVVAGSADQASIPDVSSVRAFYMDGTQGVMFRKGVWHGLDCFPVHHAHVDFLFLSDAATEDEIEASKDPRQGIRTELFDFADQDTEFRITDPKGVMRLNTIP
jgi:ureidoglycolate hydrolase